MKIDKSSSFDILFYIVVNFYASYLIKLIVPLTIRFSDDGIFITSKHP